MPSDFSDFDFQIIDLTVEGTPYLFINQSGITFSKKVVEDIAYPAFVQALISHKKKAIAIRPCKPSEPRAIKFSKPKSEQSYGVSINLKRLLSVIRTMMREEWKSDMRYKITGIYYPDVKTMLFDLTSAEEMPLREQCPANA